MVLLAVGLLMGCSSAPGPDKALSSIWRDYQTLPKHRALAVAGELRHGLWVAGASGGHPSARKAEEAALAACAQRREKRRMQAPCRIYAVGGNIRPR